VSRRFKLNLGIRFEPYTPWIDAKNRVVAFHAGQKSTVYPNAPLGLVYPGDPGVPHGGVNAAIWNFAPRIGFAWSPLGARTSIRGAYGIFLDSSMMSAIANRFENSPPHGMRVTLVPPPGPFDDPYLGASPFPIPIPPPRNIQFPNGLVAVTYPPDFKVAYLQSWNFTVEHELRRNLLARASYAGSKGTKLLQGVELNGGVYIPGRSTAANLASRQPYAPALTTLTSLCFCGNSMFNSLQATLEKRFSGGLSVLANYTLARSIDYGSGAGTLWPSYANPNDFRFNRGLSDFFHKHRFVTSWIWELPHLNRQDRIMRAILGGWNVNGVFSYQTGAPFTITSGQDNSFSGLGTDRADLAGDWRVANPGPAAWFNTRAFAPNAIGTFGNTGRNILIGPNFTSLDVSLVKDFAPRERLKLQFRAEAFNLPNHANFNQPASSRASATFGQITGSAAARVMQFAIKLRW
jgi:hypothetical protein